MLARFIRIFALPCTVAAALSCAAQTQPVVDAAAAPVKHFRLTFLISYSGSSKPSQSFSMDVPVALRHPGVSTISLASGLAGDPSPEVITFQCTDVHQSHTGLAVNISMTSDSEAPPIAGIVSARHRHGEFQRQVDLALSKPTVVTNEMHVVPLGKTDPALAAAVAGPAPQITVTATEL